MARAADSYRALSLLVALLAAGCANRTLPSTPVRYQELPNVPLASLARAQSPTSVYRGSSFNACPSKGPIEYVSDFHDLTISIFAGDFASQSPCGVLTGFVQPAGLLVRSGNLYVADDAGQKILAFHRGAIAPFMTYTDS